MGNKYLHHDWETFCELDIKKVGAHKYCSHESCEPLSMAYDDTADMWYPGDDMPFLFDWRNTAIIYTAFNAEFEWCVWHYVMHKKFGWIEPPPLDRWCDVKAIAKYYSLPSNLKDVGAALDCAHQKDEEGHRIMLKLSRPRKPSKHNPATRWTPETVPGDFEKLYSYNRDDVLSEKSIMDRLGPLPEREQQIWEANLRINIRGIPVDRGLAQTIVDIKDLHMEECNAKISELTDGKITATTQTKRITDYCGLPSLARDYLEEAEKHCKDSHIRDIMRLRLEGARSSTAKFEAMLGAALDNDRVCGTFIYHTAGTGRFGGSLIQPHNLAKPKISFAEILKAIKILKAPISIRGKYNRIRKLGDLMTTFASLVRAAIYSGVKRSFSVMDFSGIEARVLAWLANEITLLGAYRRGEDAYIPMAAYVYDIPVEDVSKEQRALGKAIILGAGYSMSGKTFKSTCESWGIPISMELADKAIKAYREKYPRIKSFWYDLNNACIRAIKAGHTEQIGRLVIRTTLKPFRALVIILPNGKKLFYPYAFVKVIQAPWDPHLLGKTYYNDNNDLVYLSKNDNEVKYRRKNFMIDSIFYKSIDAKTYKWNWTNTYGGKLTENVTQATARELLCDALLKADAMKLPVFIHVHDELGAETWNKNTERAYNFLKRIMSTPPAWAKGLPLAAEGYTDVRYKKD